MMKRFQINRLVATLVALFLIQPAFGQVNDQALRVALRKLYVV
jgi:hypothetical protein